MRKHLVRLFLILLAFELLRNIGFEIPYLASNRPSFQWLGDSHIIILRISDFIFYVFYIFSSFIIFRLVFRKNKNRTIIIYLVAIGILISSRYVVQEIVFPLTFGFSNYFKHVPLLYYLIDNLYYAVLYTSFGIIYFFLLNENQQKLELAKLALENKDSQLSFLQSQINPHFLFNSLNNIYSLINKNSPKALPAVAVLSEMLRFMLYESEEQVPIQKEVDYIDKYIFMQELRLKALVIKKKINVQPHIRIAPLLLVPFVENAFKFGDFSGEDEHICIIIEQSSENEIHFYIKNKIGKHVHEKGGIGILNIRKRLKLLYPLKHKLEVKNDNIYFVVDLYIKYD